jgi:hypothetical protein
MDLDTGLENYKKHGTQPEKRMLRKRLKPQIFLFFERFHSNY